jgi:alkaline phosphatase isozyme conversion protein
VDLSLGENGEIWHTEFDTQEYIEKTFPGRLDEHLSLFSNVLFHILSEYQATSAG